MDQGSHAAIRRAEVVLPGAPLDATLRFFTDALGFRVDAVFPADDPRQVVISGHGLRLRLDRDLDPRPSTLRLEYRDARDARAREPIVAPNATVIEFGLVEAPVDVPEHATRFEHARAALDGARWVEGRAGMLYRDLIPSRCGGRFIASHIRIPEGGPVPDYVHYHRVAFQMIYCRRGWVRVAYEDQGPPFVLEAGDCVLQPPQIRHRVLECSDGLEVIELGCPALHETLVDHALALPTQEFRPERDFGGQLFTRHQANTASWEPWTTPGFVARDLGIERASRRVAAHVLRLRPEGGDAALTFPDAFSFAFVLQGSLSWSTSASERLVLAEGDAATFPAGQTLPGLEVSPDLELLLVRE